MSSEKMENINPIKSIENSLNQEQSFNIDEVFKDNPEISSLFKNNKETYQEYLNSVFLDSKINKIVYHCSDASFKDEHFKPMKPNFDTLNSLEGVYNFSSNLNFAKRYGKNIYAVLLDIRNPLIENTTGEYVDDMDRPLSQALFKIGKQKTPNILAPKYQDSLKDTDGVINNISGEEYIEKHPISGREMGLPKQEVISVFDPKQIHILGSKQDIEQAKEWLKNKKI